jgi:hypothetical protein
MGTLGLRWAEVARLRKLPGQLTLIAVVRKIGLPSLRAFS